MIGAWSILEMVGMAGSAPARTVLPKSKGGPPDSKSGASADFATTAHYCEILKVFPIQHRASPKQI